MKSGWGTDPFDEDDDDDEDDDVEAEPESASAESNSPPGGSSTREGSREPTEEDADPGAQASRSGSELPWIYTRNSVTEDRPVTKQLHLQSYIADAEDDLQDELEERFDQDVPLADLREAAIKLALEKEDDIEILLKTWGYGME